MANGYELNPFSDVYTTNPYFAAYKFQGAIHRNRFIGSANLKYTSDNGFFVGFQVADDYTNDRNTNITPTGTGYEPGGDMSEQNVKQTELNLDLTAGKKFKFSKDLTFNLLVGGNYRKSVQEYFTSYGYTFAQDFVYNIQNLETPQASYSLNNEEYQSLYASGDFAYKNYLYLTITGRNDWYSTLAPGKINYLYPSVSAAFVFSELMHMPSIGPRKIKDQLRKRGRRCRSALSNFANLQHTRNVDCAKRNVPNWRCWRLNCSEQRFKAFGAAGI